MLLRMKAAEFHAGMHTLKNGGVSVICTFRVPGAFAASFGLLCPQAKSSHRLCPQSGMDLFQSSLVPDPFLSV